MNNSFRFKLSIFATYSFPAHITGMGIKDNVFASIAVDINHNGLRRLRDCCELRTWAHDHGSKSFFEVSSILSFFGRGVKGRWGFVGSERNDLEREEIKNWCPKGKNSKSKKKNNSKLERESEKREKERSKQFKTTKQKSKYIYISLYLSKYIHIYVCVHPHAALLLWY